MTLETLPVAVPLEPTTPIKPSEAIRLGCLIAPVQAFESSYADQDAGSACVFGAMALGFDPEWAYANERGDDLSDRYYVRNVDCPACGASDADLIHLNDDHRWSRERIADWLAGQGL